MPMVVNRDQNFSFFHARLSHSSSAHEEPVSASPESASSLPKSVSPSTESVSSSIEYVSPQTESVSLSTESVSPSTESASLSTESASLSTESVSASPPPLPVSPTLSNKIDPRVWPIAASALLMGSAIGIVIPVMPIFAREIGLTATDFGLVVSVMGFTRLLMNMPMAAIGDSLGRKPLLLFGPFLASVGMIGIGLSNSLHELLAWRFMNGVAGAAQMTGSQLYLSDISHTGNRARTLAPMLAAWSAGVTIGPALGGVMAEQFGIRAPFMFVGLAIAAAGINNIRLSETRPSDLPPVPKSDFLKMIVESYSTATKSWRTLAQDKNIKAATLIHGLYWFCTSGVQLSILPILGIDNFALSMSAVGGMYGLMAFIGIIGSQPAAYLSDKFGRKAAMVPGAIIVASALSLLPFATQNAELIALLSLWGIGSCVWGSTPSAYVSDLTNSSTRSQALAMLRSAGDFGMMMGAGVAGVLVDMMGVTFALEINAAILGISSIWFYSAARESVPKS
jgi:MFS transporter, DHA1 family, multidrug resistance protein